TRPSEFILELIKEGQVQITSLDGDEVVPCPTCGKGVLQEKDGKYGVFLGCSSYPECTHTVKIAPPAMPMTIAAS
ncbi:MAG: topoisomerase DNA-binding C4 zinc finger domain-containing protein, partial [Pseudomonadales bacterium]|nr:topoisomerase DNA-binding C4 zinc finger domain-containing protein [Pseudomonadales bacterium]